VVTVVFVVFLLPYTLIAIGSGYAFNHSYDNFAVTLSVGTTCVFIGAWLGAIISFLIARFLLRNKVKLYLKKYALLRAIEKTMESQGVKVILLLRISILVPFNISNYVLGASNTKLLDFMIGTTSLIPIVVMWIYVGT
jgi:uncharacterized membrane protein YdjX (TVP38/TMEM64 family)